MSKADDDGAGTVLHKQIFWLSMWYACSGGTLFLNKIILTQLNGDIQILGCCQMGMTAVLGAAKVYGGKYLCGDAAPVTKHSGDAESERVAYSAFRRNMLLVAIMRSSTILFGLVSLANVAASFTETIKASAPFFTVIFTRIILRETTSVQVNVALIPVMMGLGLCSATELSFNMIGFLAAVVTNCIDCVQNVFSKKLLNTGGLTPVELQFYTSLAAATLQVPLMLYSGIGAKLWGAVENLVVEDEQLVTRRHWYVFIDAVLFHFQSITAYYTMSLLGTVSQSVANTVKRSMLIFATILYFGNPITYLNVGGMVLVSVGVFFYNRMRINYPPPARYNRPGQKDAFSDAFTSWCPNLLGDTSIKEVDRDPVPSSEQERLLDAVGSSKGGPIGSPRSVTENRV